MARLLLLSACALLAAPACQAISCYQCSDLVTSTRSDNPLLRALGGTVQKCYDFDSDDSRFKMEQCQPPFDKSCAKSTIDDKVIRGCYGYGEEGCESSDKFTVCVCKGDYCNGAGLASPALLLLLLPAALLAGLVSA